MRSSGYLIVLPVPSMGSIVISWTVFLESQRVLWFPISTFVSQKFVTVTIGWKAEIENQEEPEIIMSILAINKFSYIC